jgi:hypothetical protein
MDETEMWFQVAEEARKETLIAGLKIPINPKFTTYFGFW